MPAQAAFVPRPHRPQPAQDVSEVRAVAVVSGHVQGVGFRYFVRGVALDGGLTGSARNLPDGRVEVVLEGPEPAVRSAVAELGGPRAPGSATRVDVRDDAVQGVQGFTVL
jgi:acylphosphatase